MIKIQKSTQSIHLRNWHCELREVTVGNQSTHDYHLLSSITYNFKIALTFIRLEQLQTIIVILSK